MSKGGPTLDVVFFVLSDPLRRRVIEVVSARPGATVGDICSEFKVSRFAIMRHLNVLESAGMIRREAQGRERRVYLAEYKFEDLILRWTEGLRRIVP